MISWVAYMTRTIKFHITKHFFKRVAPYIFIPRKMECCKAKILDLLTTSI